jgi:outer membrane protein
MDSSWGLSAQVGVDYALDRNWFINLDAKYIRMDTTAELDSGGVVREVDVDIDPWFLSIGVGRRF